jgi:hypothetical protein
LKAKLGFENDNSNNCVPLHFGRQAITRNEARYTVLRSKIIVQLVPSLTLNLAFTPTHHYHHHKLVGHFQEMHEIIEEIGPEPVDSNAQ